MADRQAPLDGFIEILKELLKSLSLGGAARNRGDFGPMTACLLLAKKVELGDTPPTP